MSIIKEPILYLGSKGEKHLLTVFDNRANLSCISPAYVKNIENPVNLAIIRRLATASEGHTITITQAVRLDFYIGDVLLSDEFLVVPGLTEEAIIGAATLHKWRIKLESSGWQLDNSTNWSYLNRTYQRNRRWRNWFRVG